MNRLTAWKKSMVGLLVLACTVLTSTVTVAQAAASEILGSVNTEFKMLGPDHKVIVEVFDDPVVQGVACYVSRAKTGGIAGGLGLAEDTADASVACRQVDELKFSGKIPKQGEVFAQSASPLFKKVRVERIVDVKRNTLIYLVYSDRLIDGSPKNSVTAVPVPKSTPIPVK